MSMCVSIAHARTKCTSRFWHRVSSSVLSSVCSHMFAFICVLLSVRSPMCAFTCVLLYVCSPLWSHICALICMLAYVCSCMFALICVLSTVCCYMCTLLCVLLYVCSHMCAFICVLSYVCSPMCAFFCVRSYVCFLICAFICVLFHECSHMSALMCSHMCALLCLLSCAFICLPPSLLSSVCVFHHHHHHHQHHSSRILLPSPHCLGSRAGIIYLFSAVAWKWRIIALWAKATRKSYQPTSIMRWDGAVVIALRDFGNMYCVGVAIFEFHTFTGVETQWASATTFLAYLFSNCFSILVPISWELLSPSPGIIAPISRNYCPHFLGFVARKKVQGNGDKKSQEMVTIITKLRPHLGTIFTQI